MKNKFYIVISIALTLLTSSNCGKQSDKCHQCIELKNASNKRVYFCSIDPRFDGNKIIRFYVVTSNKSYDYCFARNQCLEKSYKNETFEYYVLDMDTSFSEDVILPNDSIWDNPHILKSGVLSLEELISMKFIIQYP